MKKKIISVGFNIPGYSNRFYNYNSSQSLLDADIVVFEPDFSCYPVCRTYPEFRGKPNFDENKSFRIKEDTERWKSEISTALNGGKTIFVFMARYEEVFVCTGERKTSGTGNKVHLYNNYNFLPVDIPSLVPKEGSELRPADNHHNLTATFWEGFKKHIRYECYMKEEIEEPLFLTKTGKLPLGGLFHEGEGKLVLLPPVRYSKEKFTEWSEERGKDVWTRQAVGFGQKLVQVLQDIDRALRTETSPLPAWIHEYELRSEIKLTKKISSVSEEIEKLQKEEAALSDSLREERKLKDLLFETGELLENAVMQALVILGYEVEDYRDGDLQIDQVILAPAPDDTRYIGETKGKNDAIKIDAFTQLRNNIQEDFRREDIEDPAVGILFGNGFRNTDPGERKGEFSDKCIRNARESGTILVRTSDLFRVASYVRESDDKEFAEKCRRTILESKGKIVEFPTGVS